MAHPDTAGIKIPPPLVFLVASLIGLWWDSPWFAGRATGTLALMAGGVVALTGIALAISATIGHRRAGTSVEPWHPTTALVTGGIYRFTRNPIYLGMAVAQLGLAICGASLGAAIMIIPAVIVIQTQVIVREERYLERKFGQDYIDYKARVRRWI